jgi:hypothetical protein
VLRFGVQAIDRTQFDFGIEPNGAIADSHGTRHVSTLFGRGRRIIR